MFMKKSIKHLPKRTQEELTVLLDLVCKSVDNCQMIILFGSYARGNYVLWDTKIEFGVRTSYQSDYDILVITNGAVKRAERKLERITNKYHDLFEYRRHHFPPSHYILQFSLCKDVQSFPLESLNVKLSIPAVRV